MIGCASEKSQRSRVSPERQEQRLSENRLPWKMLKYLTEADGFEK
jgi:hypothetical protein